ncbi:lipoyl(octanoyl) transferase [Caldanaerobius fijiensis DSM 17918]|uniref:Octanoyltransferase n=1 Tax=Caldanaerobius fijiensis DSM 17918 TaxID=1121256 RepID=A0A1M4ZD70_9THEO|nr:lipoyl(octanoyl) transferase LipB [Caldanaerobius fijiensis]SHF16003.1 lipoyl(octanoyl) transferase [Caldanaerobius fijiensis DSM 17918]
MLKIIDLGTMPFNETFDIQRDLVKKAYNGDDDFMVFVEHPHIITIGIDGSPSHILAERSTLDEMGVSVQRIDRGGDVTYHGYGQLVGYPIINLRRYKKDLHWYLDTIEDALINTLKHFKINSTKDPEYPGIWVGNNKIAAIGIAVDRWVTYHGFALNVNTDLDYFKLIIPCGIVGRGVTSMMAEKGHKFELDEIKKVFSKNFEHLIALEYKSGGI